MVDAERSTRGRVDDLRARIEHTLRRLQLCSGVAAQGAFIGAVHSGRPGSMRPTPVDDVAQRYLVEVEEAADDLGALRLVVRRADAEVARLLRRPLAPTLADLRLAIVDRGTGFSVDKVAIAMRCSATIVRKARLLSAAAPSAGARCHLSRSRQATGLRP